MARRQGGHRRKRIQACQWHWAARDHDDYEMFSVPCPGTVTAPCEQQRTFHELNNTHNKPTPLQSCEYTYKRKIYL